ncbi:MAG: restriction endonuclease subunit S [Psychrobium sp.]
MNPNDPRKMWAKCKVSDFGILIRGVSYKKGDASNTSAEGMLPVLRANNINHQLNYENLMYVPSSLISEEQSIKKGDILFAMSSGSKHLVGKSAQATEDFSGGFGAFCGLLRASKHVSGKFIALVFQEGQFRNLVSSIAKGSNINNLKREHILDYEVRLPPLEEQNRIVEKIEELFSELDKGIESLKTAKTQLSVYRQALLKHAFEGKLTEQWRKDNADKLESPEQLLTRIQQEREARYQQQLDDWKQEVEKWEADGKEGKKPVKPRASKKTEHGSRLRQLPPSISVVECIA